MRRTFRLVNDNVRRNACDAIMQAPDGYSAAVGEETRTQEQNRVIPGTVTRKLRAGTEPPHVATYR